LIEEIARVYGYNNFCETCLTKQKRAIFLWNSSYVGCEKRSGQGTNGIDPLLFGEARARKTGGAGKPYLQNTPLRTELLGLIDAFEYNQSQGNGPPTHLKLVGLLAEEEGLAEADAIVF